MLKPTGQTRTAARSRREPTMAESALWKLLRDRRMGAAKFRRQMPIGPYVADFCCPALKLIIELDGGVHDLRTVSDARRDGWLTAKAGFTVLRFGNEAVLRNPAVVFEAIRRHAERASFSP
jgi:very-short-patch-repair endonuclease